MHHMHLVKTCSLEYSREMLDRVLSEAVSDEKDAEVCLYVALLRFLDSDLIIYVNQIGCRSRLLYAEILCLGCLSILIVHRCAAGIFSDLSGSYAVLPCCCISVVSPEETTILTVCKDLTVVGAVLEHGSICKRSYTSATSACCRDKITSIDAACHRTGIGNVAGDVSKT